jgi:hypothetical protein
MRLGLLAAFVAVAVGGSAWYVIQARPDPGAAAAVSRGDLDEVLAEPHLLFRNTAVGDSFGRVAAVPIARPDGPRAIAPISCERLSGVTGRTLCVSAKRSMVTTYASTVFDASWASVRELALAGQPSRARLSQDGALAATTTFVFGDSYANPGQFSTRTLVSRVDGSSTVNLEEFSLVLNGAATTAADRNLWGVTFVDDDAFFATAATAGATWLVRGSLSTRSLTGVRADVECPSLSPDGTRIAFKKHGDLPAGRWRLAVYDLTTGRETLLAETRSVDDQAVWLDNDHVLYGLPRAGGNTASMDIWVVNADGTGDARVLIPDASSPAVVR